MHIDFKSARIDVDISGSAPRSGGIDFMVRNGQAEFPPTFGARARSGLFVSDLGENLLGLSGRQSLAYWRAPKSRGSDDPSSLETMWIWWIRAARQNRSNSSPNLSPPWKSGLFVLRR